MPTTKNKIAIANRNGDKSGKSGITIYYMRNDTKKMAIATVIGKKYKALNRQGTQYKQLVNQLFKIIQGGKYSLLSISDTPTHNLKMQFIYQDTISQLSFHNNKLITMHIKG